MVFGVIFGYDVFFGFRSHESLEGSLLNLFFVLLFLVIMYNHGELLGRLGIPVIAQLFQQPGLIQDLEISAHLRVAFAAKLSTDNLKLLAGMAFACLHLKLSLIHI